MAHPKSELVDRSQKQGLGKPSYRSRNEGSAHEPVFKTEVLLQGVIIGRGEGVQKRQAERQAAESALAYLDAHDNRVAPAERFDAESFGGPWPIFPEVLAASVHVANSRVAPELSGGEALGHVRELSLELYKAVLENLGEVVELDESEA